MRHLLFAALAATALAVTAPPSAGLAESGQGPDPDGPCLVEDVDLGEYWYGAAVTHEDLIGKVVLVDLWGS